MTKDLRTRPTELDHGSNLAEAQAAWDAQTDEQKADEMNPRPADVTLEE